MGNKTQERGVALFMTVLIMSVILAIGLGISGILIQQIRISGNIGNSVVAFYAADSGVEQQIYDLYKLKENHSPSYNLTMANSAFYEVTVECSTGNLRCSEGEEFYGLPIDQEPEGEDGHCSSMNFCVRSLGTFNTAKRAIEVNY
ncbi:MAG: hypothetical protein A2Z68_00670 [Candidatus Nealsonbacteria bacterium RBG_13_38_11]|uniref:Type 4 fimbrial biogenesis protein PilX N-terminal domain-containing protein n=1 Tax=Candidatus Nealsonbacteria bacterium RBG_13_38_11 TaxID=1801662 RepID=A0A1G2DY97_9BACT|nr:MAG: hypothetical protein A2Z68_00670 [Candidatus Nealsonbacteria bacterium RBG_13_38_11]